MKKNYLIPAADVLLLSVEDVLTISVENEGGADIDCDLSA